MKKRGLAAPSDVFDEVPQDGLGILGLDDPGCQKDSLRAEVDGGLDVLSGLHSGSAEHLDPGVDRPDGVHGVGDYPRVGRRDAIILGENAASSLALSTLSAQTQAQRSRLLHMETHSPTLSAGCLFSE